MEFPHEPTSGLRPSANGGPDSPPPRPPRELDTGSAGWIQRFHAEGRDWVARVSGKGVGGTGSYGLGMLEAVHFAHADEPDRPVREALLARGRFVHLYEEELCGLLARATPIALGEPSSSENPPGR